MEYVRKYKNIWNIYGIYMEYMWNMYGIYKGQSRTRVPFR